jgi:peroxiredoxin
MKRMSFGPIIKMMLSLFILLFFHYAQAQAVNFKLHNLDNQPVHLTDFRGQWVIVNFWATWCAPCLLEMPELQAFHEARHHRVATLGVNLEEMTANQIRPFITKLGITFPILLSDGHQIPGFQVKGLPTTFLISPDGQIADAFLGAVSKSMLSERLETLERTGISHQEISPAFPSLKLP